ncbi:MAG: hypothetical protein IKC46_01055 [Lachnospiraceae bacterium]|nr:hypothetical protein [Lachnospiraceae bacterium]
MAKDKIKCKKCRKSFEPDLYSGLCPKCGTYNGRHMDTSALDLYISGRQQAEKEHRELHEKYDQGYDQAHPKYDTAVKDYDHNEKAALLQEARESFQNRQKKETLLNGKPLQKSPFQRFVKLLFITVIIMAIMTVVMVSYSNMAMVSKTEANVIEVVKPSVSGSVIFDHELLEAPIELSVLNAGMVQELDGLSGKGLYAVTVYSGSEEYSFDAEIEDVFLQYTYEGNIYYAMPLSSYDLEAFCKQYNIWEDEIFSAYDLGGSSFEMGYLFFLTETEATDFALLAQLSRYEKPSLVLQEARILLDDLPKPEFGSREVE